MTRPYRTKTALPAAIELGLREAFIEKYRQALIEVALISMDDKNFESRFHVQQRIRLALGEEAWQTEVWAAHSKESK